MQTATIIWLCGGEFAWLIEVRHTEIHTAEPLVPEPSALEVELAIENLKSHKSPGIDQITAELIKAVKLFALRPII